MRVLLIAARSQAGQWVSEVLAVGQHELTLADDAAAARRACASGSFPLVLVQSDAIPDPLSELCKQVRSAVPQRPCTILFLGEDDSPGQLSRALAAGANDYLRPANDTWRLRAWLNASEGGLEPGGAPPAATAGGSLDRAQAALHKAEEAHRASEERFYNLLNHSAYGYVELDLEGRILFANERALRFSTVTLDELAGEHFGRFVVESDMPRALEHLHRILEEPGVSPQEYEVRDEEGKPYVLQITGVPMTEHGSVVGIQCFFLDVTDRKQAERALRDSEAKLRGLLENLPDVVLIVDAQGTIRYINHLVSGDTPESILGSNGLERLRPEHRDRAQSAVQQALATGRPQTLDTLDLFGRWWNARLVPFSEQKQGQVMIICADVTEQRAAAEAVQKEQQLLRQLLDLHERDRQAMAYEIHDGLAQRLTAAQLQFEAFSQLRGLHPAKAQQTFDAALQLVGQSLAEARRMISGLRPPILDEFGIVAAVEFLVCDAREQCDADIQFQHAVTFDRLAPPLEGAVFRIVEELLGNACRHSNSAAIRVELMENAERLHVNVRDWGTGLHPSNAQEGHFGLQRIREHARLLGGQVTIATAPGEGTHVCVDLPLVKATS